MLPEIEMIRSSAKPLSPQEIALELPDRSPTTIRQSIKRALTAGTIKQIDYGYYAHPKYVSPIDRDKPKPIPEPISADWKSSRYGALIHITLEALHEDNRNNNAYHYLNWIRPEVWRIIQKSWGDEAIRDYAKYLVQAAKELSTGLTKKLIPGITQQDVYRAIKDNVNLGGYGD